MTQQKKALLPKREAGRFFLGSRIGVSGCEVASNIVLRRRKIPYAYTQNTLCLYAKSPRLNAK